MKKSLLMMKLLVFLVVTGLFPVEMFAWVGMSTPMLHVEGRFLKDPNGKTVLLHGWMQPEETYFNGAGNRYSNPTDWTNTSNVAGMLNCLKDEATVMSDANPKYGKNHGWYASFVRVNCDFYGGWDATNGLTNTTQFNAWIQNFVVPFANHLRSRGLYLVLCATGPVNTPNNGSHNAGVAEQARLRTLWSTIANASGVKNADNIMFELMNEPVQVESSPGNGNWGSGSSTYWGAFKNWMQPIINDIRNTGANNVIWVPCLGWQGEPQGWAQSPFTGTNIGVAAHFYPAYGGVYDNPTAVQNLWNSNYKPAADRWPMIITECMWFPGGTGYDDLFRGTTAGFGNALKNAIDNQGNVSFLVGFIGDCLVDLSTSTPANCSLGTHQGTQAYFDWLPTYQSSAPGSGCSPTAITPYIQVNGGAWQQTSSVTVASGSTVILGPQPVSGGSWSWSGCGASGSSREQTILMTSTCTSTAIYTNSCNAQSTQNFTITVSGSTTGVVFYQDYNFGGTASQVFGAGNYTLSQLTSKGCLNDWASSVKVPSGWSLTMYPEDNFLGTSVVVTADQANFGNISFNDLLSSCKISTTKSAVSGEVTFGMQSLNSSTASPNPVLGKLKLQLTSSADEIGIYSLEGKQLYRLKTTSRNVEIDMSSFKSGVYVIKAIGQNETWTQKIMKQ